MTVSPDVWTRYRAWCLAHDHALSTAEKSGRYLRFFESIRGLDLDPPHLTEARVVEFLALWRDRGTKPKTLNSWVRELNLWAKFNELGWKAPYFRRRDAPHVLVPDNDLVRKLRALRWPNPSTDARNRAIIALLADQGPRRNELVHLELHDRTRTPDGFPVITVRFGKGEKQRLLYPDQSTDALLEEYVAHHRIDSHRTALFTTPRGGVSYGYVARILKEAGARVGAPWLSAHKLRHFTCDSLLDAGVSVPSVAEVLGHARWETTALYRSRRLAKVRAEQEIRAAGAERFGRKTMKQEKGEGADPIASSTERGGSRGTQSLSSESPWPLRTLVDSSCRLIASSLRGGL